jgi:predicted DNA-binding protein (UPF0251 family)
MTYKQKYRERVLRVREERNLSLRVTSEYFKVSVRTLSNWLKNIEVKSSRNKLPTKISREELLRDVELYPDCYQYERAERLGVSRTGLQSALKREGISRKKKF